MNVFGFYDNDQQRSKLNNKELKIDKHFSKRPKSTDKSFAEQMVLTNSENSVKIELG